MKKLNVAFAKAGKAIVFDPGKWDMYGGAHETTQLISTFAQMNPNINVWILGKSDWGKLKPEIKEKINVHNNIFDMWEGYAPGNIQLQDWPLHFAKSKSLTIDFSFIIVGPTALCSTRNKILKINSDDYAIPMAMMERYMGPLTIFFNETKTPYVEITEDSRYITMVSRDLYHRSRKVLSTSTVPEGITVKHITGYHELSKDLIETTIPVLNGSTSRMFLMAEPNNKLKEPGVRTNLISVYSNGTGMGGPEKFPPIREYVLDLFPDSIMYGYWPTETETPEIQNYRGRIVPTAMSDLTDQMYNTKYAFMMPIKTGGWTSAKFYKHLLSGMIPFCHKYAFNSYYDGIPDYLCLESPEDFKEKIEFLEANPDEYLKLWNQCQAMLKDEYFSGEFFNNMLLSELGEVFPNEVAELRKLTTEKTYNMSCIFGTSASSTKKISNVKLF